MAEKIETPSPEQHKTTQQEIDLLDLIKKIWAARREIIKYGVVGGIIGLIIALSIPKEYTCTVKMAPEGKGIQSGGGMSSLAAMAGMEIGGTGTDGINSTIYPEVIISLPFLVELSKIKVQGLQMDSTMTLYTYLKDEIDSPWWEYILTAPTKTVGFVSSLFSDNQNNINDTIDPFILSKEQTITIARLKKRINANVEKKTGILSIAINLQDPYITGCVADSIVNRFIKFIIAYKTNKASIDLEYSQKLFDDAKVKYYKAQSEDATHADAMQNISLESVRIERERLLNEKMLAYQIYTQAATRLELSKAKVQEETPSVTIIEPATVPIKRSNMSRLLIIFIFASLGGSVILGKIVFRALFKIDIINE
ncbi:Wzz/FepE/Etk N-terminal domain-containing protein [Porphyromonadaceae bacterium]